MKSSPAELGRRSIRIGDAEREAPAFERFIRSMPRGIVVVATADAERVHHEGACLMIGTGVARPAGAQLRATRSRRASTISLQEPARPTDYWHARARWWACPSSRHAALSASGIAAVSVSARVYGEGALARMRRAPASAARAARRTRRSGPAVRAATPHQSITTSRASERPAGTLQRHSSLPADRGRHEPRRRASPDRGGRRPARSTARSARHRPSSARVSTVSTQPRTLIARQVGLASDRR